jgi:exonuclease SbcD
MLGSDLVLSGSLVKNPAFSYVALGHIHKPQDLNEGQQPPVVYPGSIERVDFGEAQDDKFFVIAHIQSGEATRVEWRKLEHVRVFIDRFVRVERAEGLTGFLKSALPPQGKMQNAIVRRVRSSSTWSNALSWKRVCACRRVRPLPACRRWNCSTSTG